LISTPPAMPPPFGLSTEQLINHHKRVTNYARFRLSEVGYRQYDEGDHQKIETMDHFRLLLETRQEIADAINYLVGLDIQLGRWYERLERVDAL
jgi:ferritin